MSQINPGTSAVAILPKGHKLTLSPLVPDVAASKGVEASSGSRGYVERFKQDEDNPEQPVGAWPLVKTSQLVADPAPAYGFGEFPTDVKIRIVCESGGYAYSVGNNTGTEAAPVVFATE